MARTQWEGTEMGGIFISYRREDSAPYARLLSDSLGAHFGPEQIFRDVDTIGPGVDFPEAIANAVGSCQVLLAVIGDKWLSASQDGRRRLDNEGDYVRLEIAAALQRDILVVPVLLEQTRMPGKSELPPDLAELADRNAIRLTDDGWQDGVRRLAAALQDKLGTASRERAQARPAPSGWGPQTPVPSSWTNTPLPAPAPRRSPGGTGDGGGGRKRSGAIAGLVVVGLVVAAVGIAIANSGGDDDGGGGPGPTVSVTTAPESTGPTAPPLGPRPTAIRPTIDPNIIIRIETDLRASPTSGPVGTTVTVNGSGFTANERVDIDFHTTSVGNVRTDGNGAFSGFTFKVPGSFAPFRGTQFRIVATGASSLRSATAPFELA